ncbi:fibronectin type III domain-containing protein [Flavobacterium sp. NRK F10]|uniref:fibronectin type III domain-containing protein n=1 Tax=Flavobacterium sp. NRK F10 TaxID=2954931 RepID=UPI002090442E|nr:fibronectin type III domain-containing protein [Flavobacterium sp. NRK F10]MCO6174533.1 fibronectin type III domain-containing protein [Flavobacterium sp. NRK F10]
MKKLLLFFMSLSFLFSSGQVLFEGFEGTSTPAAGDWSLGSGTWKIFDNGIGLAQTWQPTTSAVYAGSRAAFLNKENVTDGTTALDWLVTPQVAVPADGQLRFFTRKTQAANYGSIYTIRVSTATQTTATDFTIVQTWTESDLVANFSVYEQKVVDLAAYIGQNVYIAFVMETDNGDRWLVDNVYVDSKCDPVTALTAGSISDTSADLSWTSGAPIYEIEYGITGFAPGTGTVITNITGNNYLLTGLVAGTTYDYYVRADCGGENYSDWTTDPYTFTTALCPIADQCVFNFIMTDSGGNGWQGNTMTISQNGVDVATIGSTFTSGGGPVTVGVPLCQGQPYQLFWNSGGTSPTQVGIEIQNPSTGTTEFTHAPSTNLQNSILFQSIAACTPPTCPQPTNITISGVNSDSGLITWTDNTSGNASEWNIVIQPAGTGYPDATTTITATVNSTSYNFSGLNSDTEYEVYINAICDATTTPDPSFWSGPQNFATTKDYCGGDSFTDSGGIGGNYSNNENVITTICPDNPGDIVTVIFNSFQTESCCDHLLVYDGDNTSAPLLGDYVGTNIPPILVSTAASGCLTFQFTSDTSIVSSGWDATVICGPPPACAQPTDLSVTNITSDSATLSWTDNNTPAISSWQIVVQPVGSGYPTSSSTTIPVTSSTYTVQNLDPNTSYEYYVLADCGATDGVSYWTGPLAFNTLFPGCNGSDPAGNECVTAVPVCTLDGYCGNTSGTYTVNTWPELSSAFCGSIENNSFLTFQATSTSITLDVNVGNCTNGSGIQFMVFTATQCGSGPVTEIECFFSMNPGVNTLNITGLTPGVTYYLMIDGFAGAICDYSVSVAAGSGGSTATNVNIVEDDTTICMGESITLNATGGNGVFNWSTDWSPAPELDTTTGNIVVFTPTAPGVYTITTETDDTNTICATSDFVVITVLDDTDPSFSNPGPICQGSPNVTLPTSDSNGITGTWTQGGTAVTEIDATTAGIYDYIFTPDASFQCADPFTMQVQVLATCTFNAYSTAVYLDNCETTDPGEYFNTTGSDSFDGGALNTFSNNDLGTYVQNSGNLVLKGGALKSFKTATSNVCGGNMYYRVYEASATPGTFTTIPFAYVEDCGAGNTFTSGAVCNPGDQMWAELSQAIDLTTNAPGDYYLEVYYDLVGDNNDPTQCDDTILVDNAGNNFVASFSIQNTPSFTQQNEECNSSNAVITIAGFNPGDVYAVTYQDDTAVVGPVNYTATSNGDIIITGLDAGTYSDFSFVINGCTISDPTPIVITNFAPVVTQVTSNDPICYGEDAVFTVVATPNFNIRYTINGGAPQTIGVDNTGITTITIPAPAVGTVDLALTNIFNTVCDVTVFDTSSVTVNPLPTASISAASPYTCLGTDAIFNITGTADAEVNYSVNGGATQMLTLDATGNYVLNITSTTNLEVVLLDVTNPTTNCTNTIAGQVATVAIVSVPDVVLDEVVQPTCDVQEGTITIAEPLISQLNYPGNLFISEVTDASNNGSSQVKLNYIEIYNGTGAPVDLSNYKVKVDANVDCEITLSGMLANDDLIVVKYGTATPIAGVAYDFEFTGCTGDINNNDMVLLTDLNDVVIDVWGQLTYFTPGNQVGYNYKRNTLGTTLPSPIWDPADWTVTDWTSYATDDYSDVGIYTLFVASYEYILSDGNNSTTITVPDPNDLSQLPTFTNVTPGTYTVTAYDTAVGCYSASLSVTIDPAPAAVQATFDPVTLCLGDINNIALPTTSLEGYTGQWTYGGTAVTNIDTSVAGTFTYDFTPDAGQCATAGTLAVTITDAAPATFNPVTLCLDDVNAANIALPATSLEGYTGQWTYGGTAVTNIDTSVAGTFTYDFTPDGGQCAAQGTLDVTISDKLNVSFESVEICANAALEFPVESYEGYSLTGTWNPSEIATSIGTYTYTFTPDDVCYAQGTFVVDVIACEIPKGISPNGDGLNDEWDLTSFNVTKVEIFNRYGLKVYSKSGYTDEWHGQSDNGNDLPSATYYYVVEFNDMPTRTGWVYINREE